MLLILATKDDCLLEQNLCTNIFYDFLDLLLCDVQPKY